MVDITKRFVAFSSLDDLGIEEDEFGERLAGLGGRLWKYEDNGHTSACYSYYGEFQGRKLFYNFRSRRIISGSDKSQKKANEVIEALREFNRNS